MDCANAYLCLRLIMEAFDNDTFTEENIAEDLGAYYRAIHESREKSPDYAMISARKSLEAIVQVLIGENGVAVAPRADLGTKIRELKKGGCISENIQTQMHSLRLQTNRAAHHDPQPFVKRDVNAALVLLSCITEWFCMQHATLYDGRLIELLERNLELEREYLEGHLLAELEVTKNKVREAEELAEQSFVGGIAVGVVGMIGALAGAKFLKKKKRGLSKQAPVIPKKRAARPLTPQEKARLAAILRSGAKRPKSG